MVSNDPRVTEGLLENMSKVKLIINTEKNMKTQRVNWNSRERCVSIWSGCQTWSRTTYDAKNFVVESRTSWFVGNYCTCRRIGQNNHAEVMKEWLALGWFSFISEDLCMISVLFSVDNVDNSQFHNEILLEPRVIIIGLCYFARNSM